MKELSGLQDAVKRIQQMFTDYEDLQLLIEMSEEEPDEDTIAEIEADLARFSEEVEEQRIQTMLTGEYDKCNAIVTLHSGAGGTEAKLFKDHLVWPPCPLFPFSRGWRSIFFLTFLSTHSVIPTHDPSRH